MENQNILSVVTQKRFHKGHQRPENLGLVLKVDPPQSNSTVRPAIWVFVSLVRTSNMTNVEANHSSTGMTSGSHLPSFNVTTLRPNWSLVSLTLFNTAAQT